ncbi:uncharacterized protein LOC128983958 [Macrosteles quadrilineatus]|uniref:uncharacterized protein LOC128983956 n=1 Tax=Macrosteles quadrilineatus TaxID=74068 RepID=UPI0023E1F442|nr:uncharacterized protein LOC128983956 [Macrosteles quadrilineatus]XP_054259212.1 uncharacterized protein LOC128983958 [Macrosteles quadrilineatus]
MRSDRLPAPESGELAHAQTTSTHHETVTVTVGIDSISSRRGFVVIVVLNQTWEQGCSLNLNSDLNRDHEPVFLSKTRNGFELAMPQLIDEEGVFKLGKGDELYIACPGSGNEIKGFTAQSATSTCVKDKTLQLRDKEVYSSQLECKKKAFTTLKETNNDCGDYMGKEIQLGFEVEGWHPLVTLCYDQTQARTLHTTHILYGSTLRGAEIKGHQTYFNKGPRHLYQAIDPVTAYKQATQRDTLSRLLGEDRANYMLARSSLAYSHLSPNGPLREIHCLACQGRTEPTTCHSERYIVSPARGGQSQLHASQATQRDTLSRLLGEDRANYMLARSYLARSHLSPDGDFLLGDHGIVSPHSNKQCHSERYIVSPARGGQSQLHASQVISCIQPPLPKWATQRDTLSRLLGEDRANYMLARSYLARSHLSPDGDFLLGSWQHLTYFYINTAPMWQKINGGNWLKLETTIRNFATSVKEDYVVTTGTFGVMEEDDSRGSSKKIYLDPSQELIPVPKLFWKILANPNKNSCIVFLVHNNPFLNKKPSTICNNICQQYGWPTDMESVAKGFTYCCTFADFKKVVNYAPELSCKNVLDSF